MFSASESNPIWLHLIDRFIGSSPFGYQSLGIIACFIFHNLKFIVASLNWDWYWEIGGIENLCDTEFECDNGILELNLFTLIHWNSSMKV